ncbi:MAG: SusC/RagA family TonB-linked outer membrane protein [Bacteroidales bacterium]|nr:SusC/RagA family TonB-linked outer membrane protein [Bacteroidales bacterium]
MKLMTILVFAGTMGLYAHSYSQVTKIDLNLRDSSSLADILQSIENNSEFIFVYDVSIVNANVKKTITAKNEKIETILDDLFQDTGVAYLIDDRQVFLYQKNDLKTLDVLLKLNEPLVVPQQKTISGRVTSAEDGSPLAGVTIVAKGTTTGTVTRDDGGYAFTVPGTATTLTFTFIGRKPVEAPITVSGIINVTMEVEAQQMEEVVVTALNITKQKKALGYSIQEVKTADIERTKENNVINTLAGKIAGITINRNASGVAGTSRVIIRGANSLSGNNQPLYVVDGVPIDNTQFGEASRWGGIDQGDGLSTSLNAADIESISVLKGPNAAALYGSRAANGVILVTTKAGTRGKGVGVTLSTMGTWDTPLVWPALQNVYGQGTGGTLSVGTDGIPYTNKGVDGSWGPKMAGQNVLDWTGTVQPFNPQPNNEKDFFRTGFTSSTTLALSGGNEKITSRLSLTNDDIAGLQPTNIVKRKVINLRTTVKLSDKLSFDSKVTYTDNFVKNRVQMADLQGNPAYNFTVMPRNVRTVDAMNYIIYPAAYPTGRENLWTSDTYKGNPYWTINKERTEDKMNRITGFVSMKYDFSKWLDIQLRTGLDRYDRSYLYYRAMGTQVRLIGDMTQLKQTMQELNSDFLLTARKEGNSIFNGFISVGGNIYDQKYNYMNQSGTTFKVPDYYVISNTTSPSTGYYKQWKEIRSLYASGQVSYKNYLFFDLTARNDWSSTLPKGNNSYFYPSATMSFVFTDALPDLVNPDLLTFGKLRGSWARVGNDTSPYQTLIYYGFNADNYNGQPTASISSGTIPLIDLKPELTASTEFGTDLRFLDNRISVDLTYYSKKTTNQILSATIARSTGSSLKIMNAGEISNKGLEMLITGSLVKETNFTWDLTFNFAKNKSKVVSLMEGISTYIFGADRLISVEGRPGQPYGNLYAAKWLRDPKGNRMIDASTGLPLVDGTTSNYQLVGNFNPDWTGGLSSIITYKGFSLYCLVDIRKGGEFLSLSNYYMDAYGTSVRSLEGREGWYASEAARGTTPLAEWTPTGGYVAEGVTASYDGTKWVSTGSKNTKYVNPENYFGKGVGEQYINDGSFVKLRELSIGYDLPRSLFNNTPIQGISVSLIGRNLFFIYRACKDFDPESTYNSTTFGQGVESHAMPTTRSIGFSVKVTL